MNKTLWFIWLAKCYHILPFQVWQGGDQPIDINEHPTIQEIKQYLYFISVTSHWAKRSQNHFSAKSRLLKGGKLYMPTLIGRNSPCTKVQWMMGAVCHQQTPLSYTAEIRNVIIFCHFVSRQYRHVAIIWHDVKTCRYHKSTIGNAKHLDIVTKEHQQKKNTPTHSCSLNSWVSACTTELSVHI